MKTFIKLTSYPIPDHVLLDVDEIICVTNDGDKRKITYKVLDHVEHFYVKETVEEIETIIGCTRSTQKMVLS